MNQTAVFRLHLGSIVPRHLPRTAQTPWIPAHTPRGAPPCSSPPEIAQDRPQRRGSVLWGPLGLGATWGAQAGNGWEDPACAAESPILYEPGEVVVVVVVVVVVGSSSR